MRDKPADRGTVFISYSHKDEVWKDLLVKHLEPLRRKGLVEVYDDQAIGTGSEWQEEIQKAINRASVAVTLVSSDFLSSKLGSQTEVPQLLDEATKRGVSVFPVLIRETPLQGAEWLNEHEIWSFQGKPLGSLRGSAQDSSLAALARQIMDILESENPQPSRPPAEPRVSISRLPTTSQELFGREAELKALDDAWEDPQIRVVNIIGMGGIGKTALVGQWLSRMARDRSRGAEQVFAWSFSDSPDNQGFLEEALRWFGEPQTGRLSAKEQAERLATLIQKTRTLLILDDLEAFTGPAKDHLLRQLSSGHRGLVVLVSRLTLAKDSDSRRVLRLDALPPDAGAALLRSLGVQGTEQELAAASSELAGHPLALTLSGAILRQGTVTIEAFITQIRQGALQLGKVAWPDAAVRNTDIVQRMLGEYEKSLEPAELALLWVHGLFDRPATRQELAILLSPPVPGLTDAPEMQSEQERTAALGWLAELGLLALGGTGTDQTSRAHPLLREYFRDQLRKNRPEAFRLGHERLFRYLISTVIGQPQSLEEMAPLRSAVVHGCAAGLREEALKLYRDRISHGEEQHLTRKFGAPDADLLILGYFFESPWTHPKTDISEDHAAFLLRCASVAIQEAGLPREALAPTAAFLARARATSRSSDVHWAICHQSELQLSLGNLGQALVDAQSAVELAEQGGSTERIAAARIALADAMHQAGQIREAGAVARDFDLPSYRYFDLLLSQGRFRTVLKQASTQRSLAEQSGFVPRMALFHLALGRAHMEEDLQSARPHLDRAVQLLLRGGAQHWLPAALVARASLLLRLGRLDESASQLKQALEAATRGELRLQEADAHLAFTRLSLKTGEPDRARQSLSRARSIVDETGYHRRDAELQELEERLSAVATESPLDPVALAFRLVLAGHATPDLLLHPDPRQIEEAARRLSDEPGDPLLRAQRLLEEQQPGVFPNPLWAAWVAVTHGPALQQLGRRSDA